VNVLFATMGSHEVSDDRQRPQELGAFLGARRASIDPREVGLDVRGQPRRVSGLRREEVAQLAGISTDYYTRLEQGRLAGASDSVLHALGTALQLDPDERTHLLRLAGKTSHPLRHPRAESVRPQTQLLIDNLRDSPAVVLGCHLDVLAWNSLATAVFRDFTAVPRRERNFLRMLFLDPLVRGRYVDWAPMARTCVGYFRAAVADGTGEPRLLELIGDLSLRDRDFRTWWAAQTVNYQSFGTKTLKDPTVGPYPLDWQVLRLAGDESQIVLIMTAPIGSNSRDVLRELASRTAPAMPLRTTVTTG
jgi:transcriptional regulator with XRE-family HTH domain